MVTIVSDAKQFVFVHIPKCAGASITKMIQPLVGWQELSADAEAGRRGESGRIIREHAPLEIVRDRYPDELARFERYQCYAITREPQERFLSSVAQHLRSFRNRELTETPPDELKRVIDDVMAQMARTPLHAPEDYIHFTRQADYIFLDGRQVVGNLYRIETLDALTADMSRRHGMALRLTANKNETSTYRSEGLKQAMHMGGKVARQVMPKGAYHALRQWARGKAVVRAKDARPAIFDSDAVRDFCRDFYAQDRALWEATRPA